MLERDIDVDDDEVLSGTYRWVPIRYGVRDGEQFLDECLTVLDQVAAHLAIVFHRHFFEKLICERVFFSMEGRHTVSLARWEIGGASMYTTGGTLPPLAPAVKRLRQTLRSKAPGGLGSAQALYMQAVIEPDRMKSFLWLFDALEMLAHYLGHQHYSAVSRSLGTQTHPPGSPGMDKVIETIMLRETTAPLAARFAVAALSLFPGDLDRDINAFSRVKKARDDLAHGVVRNVDQLPTGDALILVEKYLAAAVDLS
jgi:hypothetical protein